MLKSLGIFILIFCGCTSKHKENKNSVIVTVRFKNLGEERPDSVVKYAKDGITREIPDLFADNISRDERQKVETALRIGTLENGFDGEQIRINGNEYGEYKNGWNRFLIFTKKASWTADVYYIRYAVDDGFFQTIASLQYQKHSLGEPKSGWKAFEDSVNNLGLFTLPHYSNVHGYGKDLATDERSYEVEIGRNNYCRIYSYPEPNLRVNKFVEVKNFMHIIDFIKREFKFPKPVDKD